jgi:hypothetical protein
MGYPADYGFGVNLMFSTDLLEPTTQGTLSGIVTDGRHRSGHSGPGQLPQHHRAPVATTDGFYTIKLEAGSVPVRVESEGYITLNETVVVAAGEDITRGLRPGPGAGQRRDHRHCHGR